MKALLLDKPKDLSSFDVIRCLKKKGYQEKMGHAGTLDPFATGLMIILFGQATRLNQYLQQLSKTYEATIKFGEQTLSADNTTSIIQTSDHIPSAIKEIENALPFFIHQPYLQTPPMFSATKHNGQKLYEIARLGKSVERNPKLKKIFSFQIMAYQPPYCSIEVCCSSGTYIRTLAEDLATHLNTYAHLTSLRRIKIGNFSINQAQNITDHLNFITAIDLLEHIPQLPITHSESIACKQGKQQILKSLFNNSHQSLHYTLTLENQLIAIVKKTEHGYQLECVF